MITLREMDAKLEETGATFHGQQDDFDEDEEPLGPGWRALHLPMILGNLP